MADLTAEAMWMAGITWEDSARCDRCHHVSEDLAEDSGERLLCPDCVYDLGLIPVSAAEVVADNE